LKYFYFNEEAKVEIFGSRVIENNNNVDIIDLSYVSEEFKTVCSITLLAIVPTVGPCI